MLVRVAAQIADCPRHNKLIDGAVQARWKLRERVILLVREWQIVLAIINRLQNPGARLVVKKYFVRPKIGVGCIERSHMFFDDEDERLAEVVQSPATLIGSLLAEVVVDVGERCRR